jgi:hypothetical protein
MVAEELAKYAPIEIVLVDVKAERQRQNDKWASQPEWHDFVWSAILGEEYGEVQNAMLEVVYGSMNGEDLYKELIQVAAVAVAQAQKLRKVLDAAS